MLSLIAQIRAAQRKLGWSVQELLEKSGLGLDRSTLQRKLAGDTPTSTNECQALAEALGITLLWVPHEAT